MKHFLMLLLITAVPYQQHIQAPTKSLIKHVTIIDVQTGSETKDQTVVLEGRQLVSISGHLPAGVEGTVPVVDAHEGFLIPGLRDMHVHVHDVRELPIYIANGVTGVRIMSGEKDTQAFRTELAKQAVAPQIYIASAIVDGPNPRWPGSIVIKNAADARKAVDEIKASGADFIKVYDGISRSAYFALADEAKKQSIDFEGHVPEEITAQEASANGQRSMEHLSGIALGCSRNQQSLMSEVGRAPYLREKLMVEAEAYRSVDPLKCQALFNEFRQNNTWQVPTLTVNRMHGRLDDRVLADDSRERYIDKKSRNEWSNVLSQQTRRWGGAEYALARGVFTSDERVVNLMFKMGVPIMAGTDAMNPFCFPGFSLHDELSLLVESGLTPLAALQAATINPAKFLGRTQYEGSISVGKIADLVLLDSDPLIDIHNTTHIQAVWRAGQYFDRQALDQILKTARSESSKN